MNASVVADPKGGGVDSADLCYFQCFTHSLYEYEWPEKSNKYHFLQEHLSHFLEIKAFHRKYEDLKRRYVTPEEKHYLLEISLINETEANFRLVALKYKQVVRLMKENFPARHQEYSVTVREREISAISRKRQAALSGCASPKTAYREAVSDSIAFNKRVLEERLKLRTYSIDLQTMLLHVPRKRCSPSFKSIEELELYPVSLMPGQFQTHFNIFNPRDLLDPSLGRAEPGVGASAKPHKQAALGGAHASVAGTTQERPVAAPPECDPKQGEDVTAAAASASPSAVGAANARRRGRKRKLRVVASFQAAPPPTPRHARRKSATTVSAHVRVTGGSRTRASEAAIIACAECKSLDPLLGANYVDCAFCRRKYHAACMDVNARLLPKVKAYDWACYYCKKCVVCRTSRNSSRMLLCDSCDRPYHSDCLQLEEVPTGRWTCSECGVCASCLKRKPTGFGWILERVLKNAEEKLLQVHCFRCSKRFREGLYCPVCLEVHYNDKLAGNTLRCSECGKLAHKECMTATTSQCLVCSGVVDRRI